MSDVKNILNKGETIVATLVPAADKKELFYSSDTASNGCIGYLRGDYGRNGTEFWTTWCPNNDALKSDSFRFEFDQLMNVLRKGILKNYDAMETHCYKHPSAQIKGHWLDDGTGYGFYMSGEHFSYFLRCILRKGDYNFYIVCYDTAKLNAALAERGVQYE